jgi:hypothetical protein
MQNAQRTLRGTARRWLRAWKEGEDRRAQMTASQSSLSVVIQAAIYLKQENKSAKTCRFQHAGGGRGN